MALFGLLPDKGKYVDENGNTVEVIENKDSFYLSTDESKSFGDIDYMRKKVQVKKTFPKTKNSKGAAIVKEVSADEAKTFSGNRLPAPATAPVKVATPAPAPVTVATPAPTSVTVATPAPVPVEVATPTVTTELSTVEDNIDFLQMARNLSGATRASTERNVADSYLDRFRSMAQEIGKS